MSAIYIYEVYKSINVVLCLCSQQAADLGEACPELELVVFTDRDVTEDAAGVAKALETADAFFASLVFDYDNVRVADGNY